MSLLDAMLLESHRDKRDIWIALRTDGVKGSGTENDPYNGGVKLEPAVTLTALELGGTTTAIATTSGAHGYAEGDLITVAGAWVAGSPSIHYNGTFVIHSVEEDTFKYEMSGNPGADAQTTPAPTASRNFLLFDEWMKGFHTANLINAAIHLGPGIFQTRGNGGEGSAASVGWRVRNGWKITGSGIDVTTLKVVGALNINLGAYHAIGPKEFELLANYAEVSELTVDCNLMGTENGAGVTIAAVRLVGSHVRVRRVRAIEFGSWQPRPQGGDGPECFVIGVGGRGANLSEPRDCRIEDCVVERRALLPVRGPTDRDNTTCLIISSGEAPGDGVMEHPHGCVIRNNYVDGTRSDGSVELKHQVWGCSASGVGAIVERNRFYNVATGGTYHDSWPLADTVIRNNEYRNVVIGVWEHMGNVSKTTRFIKFKSLTSETVAGKHFAHAETFKAHGLTADDTVTIVDVAGSQPVAPDPDRYYYGTFDVIPHATDANRFDYEMAALPSTSPLPTADQTPAFAFFRLAPHENEQRLMASLTYSPSTLIAEAKIADSDALYGVTFSKHDFKKGDIVQIIAADPPAFNGRFIVTDVPDDKTFRYQLLSDPGGNSNSGYYGKVWQTKKLFVENNVFELARQSNAVGVQTDSSSVLLGPPYIFPKLLLRHNVFSHFGDQASAGELARAVSLQNVENALIESNKINLAKSDSIWITNTKNARCFNNRNAGGKLIHAFNDDTGKFETESLETRIQDAILMSL